MEIGKFYIESLEEDRINLQNIEGFYIEREDQLESDDEILVRETTTEVPQYKKKSQAKKTSFKQRRRQMIKEGWERVSRFSRKERSLLRKVKRVNWTLHEDMVLLLHPKDYCLNVAKLDRTPEALKRRLQRLKKAGLTKKY